MKKLIILTVIGVLFSTAGLSAVEKSDWEYYQKQGHKGIKWDSFVESGFSSFDSGNLGPAEVFLQRAVARGCNDGLVYVKIGLFYETQNNAKKALAFFQKALKKLPEQYPGHQMTKSINEFIGRILYTTGQREESITYLQKALNEGENFSALYFLGQIYATRGEVDKAVSYFERALNAPHPKGIGQQIDILIMTELGKIYYAKGDVGRSAEWWNRILAMEPQNPAAASYKAEMDRQKYKAEERKVLEEILK